MHETHSNIPVAQNILFCPPLPQTFFKRSNTCLNYNNKFFNIAHSTMYKHMHYVKFAYKYMISNGNMPGSSRNPKPCACDLWGWLVVTGIRMWTIWDLQHTFSHLSQTLRLYERYIQFQQSSRALKFLYENCEKQTAPKEASQQNIHFKTYIHINKQISFKPTSLFPIFFILFWVQKSNVFALVNCDNFQY